jgi:hypothetical protein
LHLQVEFKCLSSTLNGAAQVVCYRRAAGEFERYVSASRENEEASHRASIEGDSACVDNQEAG